MTAELNLNSSTFKKVVEDSFAAGMVVIVQSKDMKLCQLLRGYALENKEQLVKVFSFEDIKDIKVAVQLVRQIMVKSSKYSPALIKDIVTVI